MIPSYFLSKFPRFIWVILLVGSGFSCANQHLASVDPIYQSEIASWRTARVAELTAPDGWMSLAGLFWLNEGANTFGSAPDNQLVFPAKAPAKMGTFFLQGDSVWITIAPGIAVSSLDGLVNNLTLSGREKPVMLEYGSLSWFLLNRGGRFGIRLRDAENGNIQSFTPIDHFSLNASWRVPAKLLVDKKKDTLILRNVVDMDIPMPTEGKVQFEWGGKQLQLSVLDGGPDEYFIIFADQTTGEETYSGGRYLYAPRADSTGMTYLDFNKAYNPPCAFTPFATCLLPPAENRLDIAIRAGEKNYGEHEP